MTRKDYLLLAAALRSARVSNSLSNPNKALYNNGVDNAVTYIADALGKDNVRFERFRFLVACGMEDETVETTAKVVI